MRFPIGDFAIKTQRIASLLGKISNQVSFQKEFCHRFHLNNGPRSITRIFTIGEMPNK